MSRRRTLLFWIILILITYAAAEGFALAVYAILERQAFSFARIAAERSSVLTVSPFNTSSGTGAEVLHPYLGYVVDPLPNTDLARQYQEAVHAYSGLTVNDFGFIDSGPPLRPARADQIIVGIFGGSVAHFLSAWGVQQMLAELRRIPRFANKEFVVVRVAIGGFKQPQQLLALSYLLSLGAHFDMVINLDGFNEVVLPPAENIPQHVFPFFPRNWQARVQTNPPPATLLILGRVAGLVDSRRRWGRWAQFGPMRYSVLASTVWKLLDDHLSMELAQQQREFQQVQAGLGEYQIRGPSRNYATAADLYRDLAKVWRDSSIQMAHLATGNGFRYFHFLQPNQYVPDSKPLSSEERRTAYVENHPYANLVRLGYPHLREAGQELLREGVAYADLTQVFATTRDTLYADVCCHLGKDGNERLGTAIGKQIAAWMQRTTEPMH